MKTAGKALFPNIDFPFVVLLILLIISATHPCAAKLKTPSNTVAATIQVGPSPGALVCSPDGRFVYVNCADEIAIIDTTSFQVIATVAMPYTVTLSCLAISPDGQNLYTVSQTDSNDYVLYVLSSTSKSVTAQVSLYGEVRQIAMTPDGTELWITNVHYPEPGLFILDTANLTGDSLSLPTSGGAYGVAFTAAGQAYVSYGNNDAKHFSTNVALINVSSETLASSNVAPALHAAPLAGALQLTMNPNGQHLYAIDLARDATFTDAIAVNTTTGKTKKYYSEGTGQHVMSQAVTPDGNYLYLGLYDYTNNTGTVTSFNAASGSVIGKSIPITPSPAAIAISPDGKYAYVSSSGAGTVTMIDIAPL
jgi:DNA-binding beta-propeller fold protein YncE